MRDGQNYPKRSSGDRFIAYDNIVEDARRVIDRYDNDGIPFCLIDSGMSIMVNQPRTNSIIP